MLLMSPTDTTARHGLEDSSRLDTTSKSNASFLVQMPLSILGSYLRKQAPTSSEPNAPTDQDGHASTPQLPALTTTTNASPALSRPPSSGSSAAESKPKERLPRSKTSYLIAKPAQPVKSLSKVHLRPKVLLQLHQVIASQHPKPVYEFIPFSILPQRSTRRFARTFNTRERLGPKDLLIIKAEDYSSKETESRSDDERWGSREVIGVITPGKCEKGVTGPTEICMADGTSRWAVCSMPNGGYEFNTIDDHGLPRKARWVLKSAHSRRVSGTMPSSPQSPMFQSGQDKKFNFSTISANSRRHPIIATLTPTRIDINDTYSIPSATSPPTPIFTTNTPPSMTPSSIDANSFLDHSNANLPIVTDDALRRFVVVSGLWIAFQDFSPDNESSTLALSTAALSRPQANRSMSLIDSPRSASPASTIDENRRSVHRMMKRSLERLPRCTSFTEPSLSMTATRTPSNASSFLKTRSRRANSTGNVQLQSMTGSLKKNTGVVLENQVLQESEEERRNRRSSEVLRLKQSLIHTQVTEDVSGSGLATIPSRTATPPTPKSAMTVSSQPMSLPQPNPERERKVQSAFNPVTTTGLWDSGVTDGSGLRKQPTSMFVMNERKKKQEKRKSVENQEVLGLRRKSAWYKYKLTLKIKGMFQKERS